MKNWIFEIREADNAPIIKNISVVFIALIFLFFGDFSQAQNIVGKEVELAGELNEKDTDIEEHEQDEMEAVELVERPDDIDTDDYFQASLFEKTVSIGLEYESNLEILRNYELENDAEDNQLTVEQILIPEVFYALTEDTSLFISLEFFYEGQFYTETNRRDTVYAIDRKEMWLFFGNLFESNFSLQMGRQAVEEERQWWWGDEELDSIRMHYDGNNIHWELLVGQELAESTTAEKRIEPEKEDLLRVMGQLAWGWKADHRLDTFFLYQNDHSSLQALEEVINENSEDASDADLLWIGGRVSGQFYTERSGSFQYWLDAAGVFGKEELLEFEEAEDGYSEVSSSIRRDVAGWGFDTGLTWWTDLKGRPYLNLGYAWGSGDSQSDPGKDRSFRQTGLHGSEHRFAYYGILLDPELSNLQILTASLGFQFREFSFIELAYHDYHQVKSSSFLRGAEIDVELEADNRDVGYEWDLVVIIEDWENIELKLFGSMFCAGAAFGSLHRSKAYYTGFEMTYRF